MSRAPEPAEPAAVPTVAELVAVAEESCRAAARLLRRLAAGEAAVEVHAKGATGFDAVTAADLAVEDLLRRFLTEAVPGSAVVGEERGRGGTPGPGGTRGREPGAPGAPRVTWYVDPIDGTGNFLRGLPLACVSVGAAVGGRVVAGCVLDPYRDECFTGGEGVPLRIALPDSAPGRGPLRAVPATGPRPLLLTDLPLPGRASPAVLELHAELLAEAELRRVYSTALSLAWVAAGRADAACNLPIHPWDVAGGAALVRAAGGSWTPVGVPASGGTGGAEGAEVEAPGFVALAPRPHPGTPALAARLTPRLAALAEEPSPAPAVPR